VGDVPIRGRGRATALRGSRAHAAGAALKVKAVRSGGLRHELTARQHTIAADEPAEHGGADSAPSPTELLALSLASCTAITIEMYAERKGWDLGAVEVEVDYELLPREGRARFDQTVRLPRTLTDEQVERIISVAGKCPVHRTLLGDIEIAERVERV
jgi:putative redox protein